MPRSVLEAVDVDHRVPIADMGYILMDILATRRQVHPEDTPQDILLENKMTEQSISGIEDLEKLGTRSNFSCPDCGGGLWTLKNDKIVRYRCYTGHAYTEKLLNDKLDESLEESLWISLRMLEERKRLLETTAFHQQQLGNKEIEKDKLAKAADLQQHITRLKGLIDALAKHGSEHNAGFE
jgi:two-component system chemotaxis response regulator CheB